MEILELSCERLLVDLKPFRVHLKSCHLLHDTREKDRLLVSVTRYRHLGGGGGGGGRRVGGGDKMEKKRERRKRERQARKERAF